MRESPMGMSQIGLYQSCPQRWAFKYLLGWIESDDILSIPLTYGQAIHEGKEEFYKTGSLKAARTKTDNYLRSVQMPDETFLSLTDRSSALWTEWSAKYGLEDLERYHIIGVERQGWLELPNGIRVSIRIDLLVRDKKTGDIFIVDTKTTKGTVYNMLSGYFYKAQPRVYCAWLLKEEPSLRRNFRGWITDVCSQRELKAGLITDCQRSDPVMFDNEQINATLISLALVTDEISMKVKNVVNDSIATNYTFPCNYNNCKSYNKLCPYYDQCGKSFHFGTPPPSKFTLDPWIESRTVLKEYL